MKLSEDAIRYLKFYIPETLHEGLIKYIEKGRPTGGFLMSYLENNLYYAIGRADNGSFAAMRRLRDWLMEFAPSMCWGSAERVQLWMQHGGDAEVIGAFLSERRTHCQKRLAEIAKTLAEIPADTPPQTRAWIQTAIKEIEADLKTAMRWSTPI